ncbi:MAG: serine hydroxymethyltransferase, partial [Dehalococcoidia bacterium]|nr:serine hydroxymethyltransferase [Dehalococcoidia bacterium]
LKPAFVDYQKAVKRNANTLATELQGHGFRIVSGGTDNHLVLMDLTPAGMTGAKAEEVLESVHITANKNAIPFDTQPPRVTSGLRLGTPAVTTRGFDQEAMKMVAKLIATALKNTQDEKVLSQVSDDVRHLTSRYPVPGQDD